jgi:hypothetical protein
LVYIEGKTTEVRSVQFIACRELVASIKKSAYQWRIESDHSAYKEVSCGIQLIENKI